MECARIGHGDPPIRAEYFSFMFRRDAVGEDLERPKNFGQPFALSKFRNKSFAKRRPLSGDRLNAENTFRSGAHVDATQALHSSQLLSTFDTHDPFEHDRYKCE